MEKVSAQTCARVWVCVLIKASVIGKNVTGRAVQLWDVSSMSHTAFAMLTSAYKDKSLRKWSCSKTEISKKTL